MRAVVGIQAQDLNAASLGIRARLAGSTASGVVRARERERSIVRTWCMRGTLHFVAREDVRLLVDLLGPVGLKRNARRVAALGVADPLAREAVHGALGDGPLTRHELAAAVRARGVRLADDPQTPIHLVARAAMQGDVCEAAPRDGEPTYALADDWLGPPDDRPASRDAALAELARRYIAGHAPAGPEDFAYWSGLGVREARAAFAAVEREFAPVRVLGDRAALVPRDLDPGAAPTARLLPAFDGLLLAHRDRTLTVRPADALKVLPRGGVVRPTLLAGGRVAGTWRLDRGKPAIEPFEALPDDVAQAVDAEAADVVRHRSG